MVVLNERDADGRALMLAGEGRGGRCILQAAGAHGVAAGPPATCLRASTGKGVGRSREGQAAPADGEHINLSTAAGSLSGCRTVSKGQLASSANAGPRLPLGGQLGSGREAGGAGPAPRVSSWRGPSFQLALGV